MAYLLWFLLGGFGAHRFYLGASGGAWVAVLTVASVVLLLGEIFGGPAMRLLGVVCLLAGFIWWVADAFGIQGMLARANLAVVREMRQA